MSTRHQVFHAVVLSSVFVSGCFFHKKNSGACHLVVTKTEYKIEKSEASNISQDSSVFSLTIYDNRTHLPIQEEAITYINAFYGGYGLTSKDGIYEVKIPKGKYKVDIVGDNTKIDSLTFSGGQTTILKWYKGGSAWLMDAR